MSKALEKLVVDTTRTVDEWNANHQKIEAAISDANARLAKAEAHRKQFALDASLGNSTAIAEIAKARTEHAAALGDIADLGHALTDAKVKLAEAEANAKLARQNLARHQAEVIMRGRIETAAWADRLIAELDAVHAEFERLGLEIKTVADLPRNLHGGMSQSEEIDGLRRIRAALPQWFVKLFPGAGHDELPRCSLAESEARLWNLPPLPEQNSKAA